MGLEDFNNRVHPLKSKLFRFALKFVRDKQDAEDVVQEVLAKAWVHRNRIGELVSFEAWCMKVARNQALDRLKSLH